MFACPNRRFLGNYLSKRQVGQVLAKSLVLGCYSTSEIDSKKESCKNVNRVVDYVLVSISPTNIIQNMSKY